MGSTAENAIIREMLDAAVEAQATITALRDRAAEVERERDHWENGCRDAFASKNRWQARATAAEAAIARLRDENEYLLALLDEAATKLENCRYSEQPMAEKIRTTLRALNRDTHHETR